MGAPIVRVAARARALARGSILLLAASLSAVASAQDPPPADDAAILGAPEPVLRIESVTTRTTAFNQFGSGYQSKAGPLLGPGSERTIILEPQLQIVALQGDRMRHVLSVPIDVVTAASPDAIDNSPQSADVISSASRTNFAGAIDWAGTYRVDPQSEVSMSAGLHIEEPLRSWHAGLGGSWALAGGDTVVSANAIEVFDWFDNFDIYGHKHGRVQRSSTTATMGVTQIVTPTTIVGANYGITLQTGALGNTWNSVPLGLPGGGDRGPELLPGERVRHAFVARASQFLPWSGALRLYYRLYADDWGLVAHSLEGQLMQRLSPHFYVGALYRFHTQTGVDFFTPLASPYAPLRTADSDLAPLDTHTVGGKIVVDLPMEGTVRDLHFEVGYERYLRTNDLSMDVFTCETGYRF